MKDPTFVSGMGGGGPGGSRVQGLTTSPSVTVVSPSVRRTPGTRRRTADLEAIDAVFPKGAATGER